MPKFRERTKPTIEAIQLANPITVMEGDEVVDAEAGDYLVNDRRGNQYLVGRDEFEQQYEAVKTPGRKAAVPA